MAPAKKKQVLKQKTKKKWYPVYAPAVFGNQLIGESHVGAAEQLRGKFINANLAAITNDMKKQNIAVKLRVNKVIEGKGQTEVIGIHLVQGFVKRLVRRGRTKVDDSFTAKTKDGQLTRIKPLILTTTTCVASTASQLRLEARKALAERASKTGFINLVQDILNLTIQKNLKEQLNKIHPIRSVDIRSLSRETVRGQVPEADLEIIPEEETLKEEAATAEETPEEQPEKEEEAAEEPEEDAPTDKDEEKKE
ncbi:hypothetical protein JXA12_01475 [Candidatus Woesearchaeota archaeon]|nr:hypothetical protein [Candidatus Woesearchaeota archaeon]